MANDVLEFYKEFMKSVQKMAPAIPEVVKSSIIKQLQNELDLM